MRTSIATRMLTFAAAGRRQFKHADIKRAIPKTRLAGNLAAK
jgi:hypothetical protein